MSDTLRKSVLFVLAGISVVASYVGIDLSLPYETIHWKLFAALLAIGVGVGVYSFWEASFEMTDLKQFRYRGAGWAGILAGSVALLGLSSWFNVSAIGGAEAKLAALYDTLAQGEMALADGRKNGAAYQSFMPRLDDLANDLRELERCEGEKGCITGTAGYQGVAHLLGQMAAKAESSSASLKSLDAKRGNRADEGAACLASLRDALARVQDENYLQGEASSAFDCVNAVISDIDGNRLLATVAQDMDAFATGLVAPVSIRSDNQKEAFANIAGGFQNRSSAIARDARTAISSVTIEPLSLPRMSAMKAVILYWDSIIPSWTLGVALDLLPLLLLFFRATRQASFRSLPDAPGEKMTVAEIKTALEVVDFLAAALNRNKPHTEVIPLEAGSIVSPVNKIVYRPYEDETDFYDELIEIEALPMREEGREPG